jgi:cytochrome c1
VAHARGTRGPTLAQFGRRSYIAGRVPLSRNTLVQWIVDPASLVPGTPMPRLGVPPAEAERLALFLLSRE